MNWYLAPVALAAVEEGQFPSVAGYEPSGGLPPSSRLHVQLNGAPPTLGLVGRDTPLGSVPAGWIPKTLAEAQAEFEDLFGRTPTAAEVF